jgi:hypothetical protein
VGKDAGELHVVGLLQKSGRDVELAAAGACGIDVRICHDADFDLVERGWVIHGANQGDHDALKALRVLWVEGTRRRFD